MKKIGFVHAYRAAKDLSLLNEGTQDGIEIGLLGLLVHCRILGDHHKVLQKLQVCHRLPQMHLLKIKKAVLTSDNKQNSLY